MRWPSKPDSNCSTTAWSRSPLTATGTVLYFHAMFAGNYAEALMHVEPDRTGPSSSSGFWRPMSPLAGFAHERLGDRAAAARAYEEALAVIDAQLAKQSAASLRARLRRARRMGARTLGWHIRGTGRDR